MLCYMYKDTMTSLPSVGILIFAHSTFFKYLLCGPGSVKSCSSHQRTFNLERMADSKKIVIAAGQVLSLLNVLGSTEQ